MKARFDLATGLLVLATGATCGSSAPAGSQEGDTATMLAALTASAGACTARTVQVAELHADFRDIWKGREIVATGKQADPDTKVGIDFNTTVTPALVVAQFIPAQVDGTCGSTVDAKLTASVIATDVWGKVTTNAARAVSPEAFSVFVRDSLTGVVSAGGALAAGGDISLTGFSLNGTTHQPFGLIAGGKIVLGSGPIYGDVSYGVASTFPKTATISGKNTQQPFDVKAGFADLEALSTLLAAEPANGTAQETSGTLKLTGTNAAVNTFQITADALARVTSLQISVPNGAKAVVHVTGATVSVQNKGVSLQGAAPATLLWNLPAATAVQISSISLPGSLLAPRARVSVVRGSLPDVV